MPNKNLEVSGNVALAVETIIMILHIDSLRRF